MYSKSLYAGNRLVQKIKKAKLSRKVYDFIEENINDIILSQIEHIRVAIHNHEIKDEIDFKHLRNVTVKDNVLILNFSDGNYKVKKAKKINKK